MTPMQGAFTALITPFDGQGGIDYPAMARLLAWHESEGMTGVVIGGTNGEGPSLSAPEKRDLVAFAVQHAGKLKVIAGLGTCSITEAVWLSNQAHKAGAAASLALPPFFFRAATSQGIEKWFSDLLSNTELPCIMYSFPKMTGITFEESMMDSIFANHSNAVGVKDSSGDRDLLEMFLRVGLKHKRSVLVGDERLLSENLSKGGAGTISGMANSFPRLVSRVFNERSEALQELLDRACTTLKAFPTPAVHKYVLGVKGLPGGTLRPPLESLGEEGRATVDAFLPGFGF